MLLPDLRRALELGSDRPEELLNIELVVRQRHEVLLELRAGPLGGLHVAVRRRLDVGHRCAVFACRGLGNRRAQARLVVQVRECDIVTKLLGAAIYLESGSSSLSSTRRGTAQTSGSV